MPAYEHELWLCTQNGMTTLTEEYHQQDSSHVKYSKHQHREPRTLTCNLATLLFLVSPEENKLRE